MSGCRSYKKWTGYNRAGFQQRGKVMVRARVGILALAFSTLAAGAFAQGNPTGTSSGHVTDPGALALPGVSVTVASPVLQGVRRTVTSGNGDYILPFLPPGDYTLTFELQGFATTRQLVGLKMADRLPVNVRLALASVSEVVNVVAAGGETATTATVATTV